MKFPGKKHIFVFSLIFCVSFLYAQGPGGDGAAPGGNPPPVTCGEHPGFFPPPPPPKDPDNIIKYRGNRTYSENIPPKIVQTRCCRIDGDMVCVKIIFNQSINPRSVGPSCILINNSMLPPFVRPHFNKKGDSIKFHMPVAGSTFKMKICNIRSFDNTRIDPVEILVEVER